MPHEKIDFLLNSNMKHGIGEFEKLPSYLKEMDFLNIAVVVDRALVDLEYVKKVLAECEDSFNKCERLIYTLAGEPTYDYLDECSAKMRKYGNIDVIVGIGGGSVIDLAKGIAVLMTNEGPGLNYRGFPKKIKRPIPVVAVPTTAGTGSDATYNAVFTDSKAQKKLGINTTMNFPVLSILDPNLISSCPKGIIASSGMDALTHALESFVSKRATIVSRMFSIEAARLLFPNLETVLDFPEDIGIKGNLQLGAYLAGIALFNSSSGPAGALSYLLGTWYKVPHGIAGAVFLPHIHRFNFEKGYYGYSILYDAIYKDTNKDEKEKAGYITDRIFFLNRKLGVEEKLSSYGVKEEDLKRFEQEALTTLKPAFDFNPMKMEERDIRELLHKIA
jgi:alcohol dehydrogenase